MSGAAELIENYRRRGYIIVIMVSSSSWQMTLQDVANQRGVHVGMDDLPDDFILTDTMLRDTIESAISLLDLDPGHSPLIH